MATAQLTAPIVESPRQQTDTDYVLSQLLESVEIAVNRYSESHPYGSTVAVEHLADVELEADSVVIDLETDTIPVSIEGDWSDDHGFEVCLRFCAPQVEGGRVTYDVEAV